MKTVTASVWFFGDVGSPTIECTRTYATDSLFDAIEMLEQEIVTKFGKNSKLNIQITKVAA